MSSLGVLWASDAISAAAVGAVVSVNSASITTAPYSSIYPPLALAEHRFAEACKYTGSRDAKLCPLEGVEEIKMKERNSLFERSFYQLVL